MQRVAEYQEQMRECEAHTKAPITEQAEAHAMQRKELTTEKVEAQAMQTPRLKAEAKAQVQTHSEGGPDIEEPSLSSVPAKRFCPE